MEKAEKMRFSISKIDIPNILTFLRLFSAPIFAIIFYFNTDLTKIISAIIFSVAGITDFLDGYLARSWDAQSTLGRVLDPIADKLIVIVAIVMLIFFDKIEGISIFFAVAILMREVVVSGIREAMSSMKFDIHVSQLGKIKTTIQILSIAILIMCDIKIFAIHFQYINQLKFFGMGLFWLAAILSVYSGYQYVHQAIKHIIKLEKIK